VLNRIKKVCNTFFDKKERKSTVLTADLELIKRIRSKK